MAMTKIHGLIGYLAKTTWCGLKAKNAIVTHDSYDPIINCKTCIRVMHYWLRQVSGDAARLNKDTT